MTHAVVGQLRLRAPVMIAAGTGGTGVELSSFGRLSELGAVVVKSLAPFPWHGNPSPRLAGVPGGMVNAVGLSGPGIPEWIARDLPLLEQQRAAVVVSVWGRTPDDYEHAAALLSPIAGRIVAVEVNLSCPNLSTGHQIFAHEPAAAADIVVRMRAARVPLWAKLSPNTDRLVEVASAVAEAGADAVTLINTVRALVLDDLDGTPVLGSGGGGLSGRVIHQIALRAIADVRAALPELAIVGVGGVADAADARAMLRAGACAVQVGTATFADPRAPWRVQRALLHQFHDRSANRRGPTSGREPR